MQYDFEWDTGKARTNRTKHGVSFEEAATVFSDPGMLTLYDDEHSGQEERWVTLGISATGRLLVVCHTFREESDDTVRVRIFSSRKATTPETAQYSGRRV
ncbi:MAG: hypothetical protein A3K19_17615 [Lentisphaerae bacterium RIFOXYB12_FULL_65_16]|nr:MAG: hypothetical protein A3K18_00565 [Lentisphaerae bacterium RIFOXYA12_64_32]OGV91519.1 MAG: hypothetical protein A3K19_17615 [Lentisphaerae bacterium RIFOXYB12_FULL_65_16]